MRALTPLLFFFILLTSSRAGDFKLYATFIEDTRVELSDGAVWMMDKGDVFPVEAYKNMQKNVILRLAGATFMTDTARIRVLKPDEVADGIEKYRSNVRSYLDSTSKKMEDKMKEMGVKKEDDKAKPAEKTETAKVEEKKAEEPKPEQPKPEEKKP